MFTADAIIDSVQTGKKTLVNTFITNETIKESMIRFIDTQAEYTKKAAKSGLDTITTVTSETVKAMQEAAKFDYVKPYEDFFKALKPATAKK